MVSSLHAQAKHTTHTWNAQAGNATWPRQLHCNASRQLPGSSSSTCCCALLPCSSC
jgi:hypothetical protein